jgi:hypothetical protein
LANGRHRFDHCKINIRDELIWDFSKSFLHTQIDRLKFRLKNFAAAVGKFPERLINQTALSIPIIFEGIKEYICNGSRLALRTKLAQQAYKYRYNDGDSKKQAN